MAIQKYFLLLLLPVLCTPMLLSAQYHTGDMIGVSTNGRLFRATRSGMVTTYHYGTGTLSGWMMDYDNENMLVTDSTWKRLFLISRNMVVTRIFNITQHAPMNLALDHNGTIFFTDILAEGVIGFHAAGGLSPVVTSLSTSLHGGLVVDIDTSHLLMTRSFGTVDQNPILQVSRDGSIISTLHTGVYGMFGMTQTMDGSLWVGSCCSTSPLPRVLYSTTRGQTQADVHLSTIPTTSITGIQCLAADRSSAPTQRLLLGVHDRKGFWLHDVDTGTTTKVTDVDADLFAVGFVGSRNLGCILNSPRVWRMNVTFPGEAGKFYQVLLSLTGVRPPTTLPDGRRVWFQPDALTVATLNGSLEPFLIRATGILNSRHQAYPEINLSALPAALNGTLIWAIAATIDASAPLGLGTISDPMVIRIE